MSNKEKIRELASNWRKNLPLTKKHTYDQSITKNLAQLISPSFICQNDIITMGIFYPLKNEIDCTISYPYFWNNIKILALPVINQKNSMDFKTYLPTDKLNNGKFAISEPPENNKIVYPQLLICPMLAYENSGYRLGYGGGFYDKYITKYQPKTVGICYDHLNIHHFLSKDYTNKIFKTFDQKLDFLITEKSIINFKNI